MVRKTLLICGILASLLYAAMVIFIPLLYEGYSSASQTVSELSAVGVATRTLWIWLGVPYATLETAFGCGVWLSAERNRRLRIAGGALILHGILALTWPPMHPRGTEFTLTDTLHIVWAGIVSLLFLIAIGFAAVALDKKFRVYSIITIVILLVFGGLTGMDSPNVAANLPTPWIGVWERINIAAFLAWEIVLAIKLLSAQSQVRRPGTTLH